MEKVNSNSLATRAEQFKANHEEIKKFHQESMDTTGKSYEELKKISEKGSALHEKQLRLLRNSGKKNPKPLLLYKKFLGTVGVLFLLLVITLAILGPNV